MWSIIRTTLAVLNVAGAVAFCVLAAKDYAVRQTWAYSVLLHDVALRGLPLNKEEKDADNNTIVDLLGENGKKDVFEGQGGPVATQLEELDRVHKKLDGYIVGDPDRRGQTVKLAHILLPLATSETERERLTAIQTYLADAKSQEQLKADVGRAALAAADQKVKPAKPFEVAFTEELEALPGPSRRPFEEAYLAEYKKSPAKKSEELFDSSLTQIMQNQQNLYNDAFNLAASGSFNGSPLAPSEQKAVIALLLFNLVEPLSEVETNTPAKPGQPYDLSRGAYQRFLTVVGWEAAVKAIHQEARTLARMTDDLRLQVNRDRTVFVTEHQDLVTQLQQAASKVAELSEALARQKDLVAKHQALVARRKEDVKLFEGELAKLGKEVADRLTEVRGMTDELYKIRVATRNATEANQKFEQKIQTLEEGK
jgi:hypothetical protein